MDHAEDPLIASMVTPRPLRILYVEDNPIVREVTAELLEQDERSIVALSTAEEALREFATHDYDVLITDVSLPAMSGLDLAKKILDRAPKAAIIVASGYILDANLLTWGPNVRAILKPFEACEIDALIADVCRGNGASL